MAYFTLWGMNLKFRHALTPSDAHRKTNTFRVSFGRVPYGAPGHTHRQLDSTLSATEGKREI